ncbi:hypothetical protein CEXT_570741 [Caerostris extrusa]|uniref:Uncharacterized protein n=1 Tax=Caerostris extrusa TaxID=172846 RepID=A0AAV4Y1V4_CAEEX|nr:hypothetical protein CEXT_570741 [Caerostris extrusa]
MKRRPDKSRIAIRPSSSRKRPFGPLFARNVMSIPPSPPTLSAHDRLVSALLCRRSSTTFREKFLSVACSSFYRGYFFFLGGGEGERATRCHVRVRDETWWHHKEVGIGFENDFWSQ